MFSELRHRDFASLCPALICRTEHTQDCSLQYVPHAARNQCSVAHCHQFTHPTTLQFPVCERMKDLLRLTEREQFPPVTAEVRVRCSAGVESVSAGLRSLSQILNSPQYWQRRPPLTYNSNIRLVAGLVFFVLRNWADWVRTDSHWYKLLIITN